jgi:flagellar hook-length control protein FliK
VDSYIELQSLMDQMDGLARTFASSDGTTVEMQLNPENLGRLTLSVSEKQGNVTAQIIASNEQVKEALQTQIVELRASLQAQGVKVQAVEVTVATHEFEQNLDGNTSANGQEQEEARQQAAQTTRRRNLDFHSLDELSGLMSEEETLAAQIMRDNGGSVDYTA